jgi:hypothetical protein
MLFVTIIIGFAMMTLGFALLVLGEVPFVAGKRIPAVRSRLIGGVLVAFGPATWVVRSVTYALFGDAVEGPVVTALMFSLCCVVIFAILFRVLVPKREPRKPSKPTVELVKEDPFGADEPSPPDPPKQSSSKKSPKAAKDGSSPFDFS